MDIDLKHVEMCTDIGDNICSICYAEFLDSEDLNVHMLQHSLSNSKNYCNTCNHPFADVELYSLHIIKEHLSTAVTCTFCKKVFFNGKLLKQHVINHNATKISSRLKCSQCNEYFTDKHDLEHHENNDHDYTDGSVDLRQCFSILSSLLNMNIWKFFEVRHENAMYYCCYCKLNTPDLEAYIHHLQNEKVKLFTCENCCEVFQTRVRLLKHIRENIPRCRTYERKNGNEGNCKKCNQIFPRSTLKRHIVSCKGLTCTECNEDFETVDQYSSHLKHHNKALQLSTCKFCFRQFVGQNALEKHFDRTHRDTLHLYKYKCNCCDQLFMHPKYLFAHYFTKHKDLQPYTCKICDKKFKIRKQFTIHIKLHHKSIGFVEFDENYYVFFNDKKSEKPFQPYSLIETDENGKPLDFNLKSSKVIGFKSLNDSKGDNCDFSEANDDIDDDVTDIENTSGQTPHKSEKPIDDKSVDDKPINEEHFDEERLDESSLAQNDYNFMNATETEYHTDVEPRLVGKQKRKTKITKSRKKAKVNLDSDSSDDSDKPLLSIKSKGKGRKRERFKRAKSRRTVVKFVCKKCNKNCYTYQNYHNHLSLHEKNQSKECIKCNEKFKSKADLAAHVEKEHSSSRLTETLKQLLERKKVDKNVTTPLDPKSIAIGLRRTIKKVLFEKSNHTTTLTRVDNKLSVKNFFENFTPEPTDSGSKDNNQNQISIKLIENVAMPNIPMIKMKKFCPEQYPTSSRPKMPVKFKEIPPDKYEVTIKYVPISQTQPILRLAQNPDHDDYTYEAETSDHHYDAEPDNTDIADEREEYIPEVAEEVMLNTEPSEKQESFILPDIPKEYSNLRIAHLQDKAPFYKIVKIDDVVKKSKKPQTPPPKPPDKIVLPDGTKLVTVNPLAHLMGDTSVEDLFKSQKKYYESKPRDIKLAIAKALEINKPSKKKKKVESESNISHNATVL